jgi:hypothetical protein
MLLPQLQGTSTGATRSIPCLRATERRAFLAPGARAESLSFDVLAGWLHANCRTSTTAEPPKPGVQGCESGFSIVGSSRRSHLGLRRAARSKGRGAESNADLYRTKPCFIVDFDSRH